jgi:hypothetical protein
MQCECVVRRSLNQSLESISQHSESLPVQYTWRAANSCGISSHHTDETEKEIICFIETARRNKSCVCSLATRFSLSAQSVVLPSPSLLSSACPPFSRHSIVHMGICSACQLFLWLITWVIVQLYSSVRPRRDDGATTGTTTTGSTGAATRSEDGRIMETPQEV